MSLDLVLARIFQNQWRVIFIVSALVLAAAEMGFRMGRRRYAEDEARKGPLDGVQGSMLGLLALLLGFTFAMAVSRYEARQLLVLQEANAIGTTYLRASFLPEAHRRPVRDLLRRYVGARIAFFEAGSDKGRIAAAEDAAAALQRGLWAEAVAAGKAAPGPLTAAFLAPLNEVIDADASQLNALRSHVPGAVWLLLLVVASVGCYATGYRAGTVGVKSAFSNALLPLLIAVVITLVADLDRPRRGLISANQAPLFDLRKSLPTLPE